MPEFSFLDNWGAEKQPTTNWYKFNSNDRASKLLALQADAGLSDLKSAGQYSVQAKTVQHIMYISTIRHRKPTSYTFKYTTHIMRLSTFFLHNDDIFLLTEVQVA
jgi:hypothetical protein